MTAAALVILTCSLLLVGCQVKAPPAEAPPAAEPVNLIGNGDFEGSDAGDMYARHDKDEPPPGWTVRRGTVDVIGAWWAPARGKQSLDLNGLGPGAIAQEVATVPGKTYVLSFIGDRRREARRGAG